jgi:hypothetical protein
MQNALVPYKVMKYSHFVDAALEVVVFELVVDEVFFDEVVDVALVTTVESVVAAVVDAVPGRH